MDFLKKNKFIVLLLFFVLIFRLPSLFEPYWYGDEGIYLSIGMGLRKGMLLYRDIFDNKPPLIYLLTAVANANLYWFRFFLLAANLLSIYFFYKVSGIFLKKHSVRTSVSTVFFALLTSLRLLEGNIANAELFILLPVLAGIFLFFDNSVIKKKSKYLLVGFLFSLGFLLKAISIFDFAGLFFFSIFFIEKKFFTVGKKEIFLILGYFFLIFTTGVYFFSKGAFNIFFNSCFIQMFGYLGSWETGAHSFSLATLIKSEIAVKTFLFLFVLFFLWIKRKSFSRESNFLLIWFFFSLFAAVLPGRPYSHYLIQVVPSFCLLIFYFARKNIKSLLALWGTLFFLTLSLLRYNFWYYPTISYYKNFIHFIFNKQNQDSYFKYFNPNLPNIYKTSELVTALSNDSEKIFIWANEPVIYVLSKRLPSTPYLVAYHIRDLGLGDKTYNLLYKDNPKVIILDNNLQTPAEIEILIKNNYLIIETIGNFSLYKLKTSARSLI